MKFESEKLSIRVQDGLTYNAILSDVYFIVYDKFISYLPFLEEINVSNNSIKSETLKELNLRKIPEKILDIYANNTKFFNKKYSINEQQLSLKTTNEERGDFILEKIIDDIEIFKNPKQIKNKNQFMKDLAFGFDNENIISCPIIVQNSYSQVSNHELNEDGTISKKFFDDIATSSYVISCNKLTSPGLKQNKIGNKYFFDKKYYANNIVGLFENSGFHFEKFISFDFNKSKYLNSGKDKTLFSLPSGQQVNFETFLYSCLNASLFLSDTKGVEKIVINPEYLKKIFPIAINDSTEANTQYQILINEYFSSFITNIKYGLRLVCRQSTINDKTSKTKISYKKEIDGGTPKLEKNVYTEPKNSLAKRPSSYAYESLKEVKDTVSISFTPMEYFIIKDKSYVLFIDLSKKANEHIYVRKTWIPIVSVYSDEVLNQSSLLPINPKRAEENESFNIKSLHDFIDDNNNKVLKELKEKMITTDEFKLFFTKIIPLNVLGSLEKISTADFSQALINMALMGNDPSTIIARSLRLNLFITIDRLLNTGGY